MNALTPERDLVRAAFRLRLPEAARDDATRDCVDRLLPAVNWAHVLWLARQHDGWPALHHLAADPRWQAACPGEVVRQLVDVHQISRLQALERERECCLIHDLLAGQGIRAVSANHVVTEEGVDLESDRFAPASTLEFFVPEEDRARAAEILKSAGHPAIVDLTRLVHRGQSPVLLNAGLGGHPQAARCRARAVPFNSGGHERWRLAPIDALLDRVVRARTQCSLPFRAAWQLIALAGSPLRRGSETLMHEAAFFGLEAGVRDVIAAAYRALGRAVPDPLAAAAHPIAEFVASVAPQIFNPPFLSTPRVVVRRMLELAGTGPGDFVCDLGCGDGRFLVTAATEFGARGLGIDCDPTRVREANANAASAGVADRVRFVIGDLFEADLGTATVVCIFLNATFPAHLRPWLTAHARPGTRVVSHDSAFGGWPPERMELIRVNLTKLCPVYLWRLDRDDAVRLTP